MPPKANRPAVLIALAALLGGHGMAASGPAGLNRKSISQLEQRLAEIDGELATLASDTIRSGTGAVGYRSDHHQSEANLEWIEVDFGAAWPLDEVVLVPVIRRDAQTRFEADAFPKRFRLIAGTADDREGEIVAEFTDERDFLPRIAPLSIPCHGVTASWIRIEADRLSLRAYDERYVLELSEIMAFSGSENVALHRPVQSRSSRRDGLAWDGLFVVDGFVPYLMDAAIGEKSVPFIARISGSVLPSLTIDLGASLPVSGLGLHAIDTSDVLPQALDSDFGVPRGMKLEGANRPDFSDARTLIDLRLETIYEMAPSMVWYFRETTCRYVRLSVTAPSSDAFLGSHAPRFGFSEIALFSRGRNIALGKPIQGAAFSENPQRPISHLTDGRNMYGAILPMREWMRQLARRHDLEIERPLVAQELNRRYERQQTNLRRLGWLSALLAGGIGFTILIDRMLRMRQAVRMRERFAADLHDEIGANLHTIGLLSDLAEESRESPEELTMLHQRIRRVTEQTGTAVRHCTDMLGAGDLYTGLLDDMERAARRILARCEHELSIEGREHLLRLRPRTQVDLYLFYKECLVNISRHSGATKYATRLSTTPREIQLTVRDNGRGLQDGVPRSLKRRARLLGARVSIENPSEGGTCVHLSLRLRHNQKIRK